MTSEKNSIPEAETLNAKIGTITAFLEDQKVLDPYLLKFDAPNSLTDAVIIATATSRRHAQGLARGLLKTLADSGQEFFHMEGFDAAQWILLDCNDVMVHIFQQDTRDLYKLDDLCQQTQNALKDLSS